MLYEESFDFDFPEPDSFSFETIEPERENDGFLEKYDAFVKRLNKGSLKNFDCVAQFYRSKEQMEGKLGVNDVGYTGSFGFQRYNESTDGDGKLSLKYFPDFVIDRNNNKYKLPFLSLWSPKSRTVVSNNISPVSKATLWCRFDLGVDNSHNSGILYYDTGTPKVRISGKQKGVIYKDTDENPFTLGDDVSFDIACVDTLTDYVFVVFRETDSSGKIIGILTVVPNNSIYKTEVNIVNIKLGYENRFISNNRNHPLRQPLLKHFNENSFNQSLISIDVNPNYKILNVDRNQLPKINIDSNGKPFINSSSNQAFHEAIKTAYSEAIVKEEGDYITRLLVDVRRYIAYKEDTEFEREKRRQKRTALQLINLIIKKFKQYSKQDYAYTKTFEDTEILKSIADYTEERDAYRYELFKAVENSRYKDNKDYDLIRDKLKVKIMSGQDVTTIDNNSLSLDPKYKIYVFLYEDIYASKESTDSLAEIAGFAPNGKGFCHIFNMAFTHKTQRDELIAHEAGHSFGLKHTFDYNKEEVDKEYRDDLKEIEDERKSNIKKYNNKGGEKISADNFIERLKNLKKHNEYRFYFELNKLVEYETIEFFKEKDNLNESQLGIPFYQEKYLRDKETLDEKFKGDLKRILNLKKGQTQENYMDYDIPKRKSFWYWQWAEMQKNVKLLEEIKLNK